MSNLEPTYTNELTGFITRHVLASSLSKQEIATRAGYSNERMIDMLMSGDATLPLGHVKRLAHALGCDPNSLMELALLKLFGPDMVEDLASCFEARRIREGARNRS